MVATGNQGTSVRVSFRIDSERRSRSNRSIGLGLSSIADGLAVRDADKELNQRRSLQATRGLGDRESDSFALDSDRSIPSR